MNRNREFYGIFRRIKSLYEGLGHEIPNRRDDYLGHIHMGAVEAAEAETAMISQEALVSPALCNP